MSPPNGISDIIKSLTLCSSNPWSNSSVKRSCPCINTTRLILNGPSPKTWLYSWYLFRGHQTCPGSSYPTLSSAMPSDGWLIEWIKRVSFLLSDVLSLFLTLFAYCELIDDIVLKTWLWLDQNHQEIILVLGPMQHKLDDYQWCVEHKFSWYFKTELSSGNIWREIDCWSFHICVHYFTLL